MAIVGILTNYAVISYVAIRIIAPMTDCAEPSCCFEGLNVGSCNGASFACSETDICYLRAQTRHFLFSIMKEIELFK